MSINNLQTFRRIAKSLFFKCRYLVEINLHTLVNYVKIKDLTSIFHFHIVQ